jgi:phosphatidylserine decarboxylase
VPGPGEDAPFWLRGLPRRALSRFVGAAARAPLPAAVLRPAILAYARLYGANLDEAERPPHAYASFLDFFARRLRPGLRPQDPDPRAVSSPCDGSVHATSRVVRGGFLQAKATTATLAHLLGDPRAAAAFEGGSQATLYLAPGDYHRFHWPFDATLETLRHLPGDLWPVGPRALERLPGVLAANERVVVEGTTHRGGAFALVAVGALDVGSIRLAFHPLRTTRGGSARPRAWGPLGLAVRRGEEAGWFELGSSLVLLLAPEAGTLHPLARGERVRVGWVLGRLVA